MAKSIEQLEREMIATDERLSTAPPGHPDHKEAMKKYEKASEAWAVAWNAWRSSPDCRG